MNLKLPIPIAANELVSKVSNYFPEQWTIDKCSGNLDS